MSTETMKLGRALVATALVTGALVVGAPQPALAHALCDQSSPRNGETLDEAPGNVWCDFTEPPTDNSTLEVYDTCDRRADDGNVLVVGLRMTVGMERDDPGEYTVVWKTTSALDGHRAYGTFSFRVRGDAPCPVPTQQAGGAQTTKDGGRSRTDEPSTPGAGFSPQPAPGGTAGGGGRPRGGRSNDFPAVSDPRPGPVPGFEPSGGVVDEGGGGIAVPLAVMVLVVLPFGLLPALGSRGART